ncbi:glycoside hydrolase family 13 [Candidatus Gracilibacteria bacterium]|nr:glycoside hydrolase family 13 [Candidatus Gracilibacteria bacterium]
MVTKQPTTVGRVRVVFSLPAAIWADTIHLVGDFNAWSEQATPMRLSDAGWTVSLELQAGQTYQYRYLIDGAEWHNDWNADRYEPNDFGGHNSAVVTPHFEELELTILPRARVLHTAAR